MYLDKVLKAMTKKNKKEFKLLTDVYTPERQPLKKYKGSLVLRNDKGELIYW